MSPHSYAKGRVRGSRRPAAPSGACAWLAPFLAFSLAFGPSSAALADADPAPPSRDAVQVRFRAEDLNEKWSLVTRGGAPLCALPCSRWLSPGSDVLLERDIPGSMHVDRISIPTDLKSSPGGSVEAVARTARDTRAAGIGFEILAACMLPLSALVLLFGGSSHLPAVEVAGGAGFGLMGVSFGLGAYLRASSHPPDVVLRAASAAPLVASRLALRPGFVEVDSPANGFHLVLTPLGVSGTF